MAIPIYDVASQYVGAGNLAAYPFDFKITDPSQLLVVVADSTGAQIQRVRGTDTSYLSSVVFDAVNGGGTVNLIANLPNLYTILLILANDAPTQPSEFRNRGSFDLFRFEVALDFIANCVQRVSYLAQRSVKLNDLDNPASFDPTLPIGMPGALSLIPATNSAGTGWAPISQWTPVANFLAAVTAATAAAASAAQAAASAVTAAAEALIATNAVATVAASIAAAAASATAAAGSAAAAVVSAAAALTSANNAAASAVTSANSATSSSNTASASATSAGQSSAAAIAALASQAAAAASASTAGVAATNALASATSAANSATSATSSAASAATSAAAIGIEMSYGINNNQVAPLAIPTLVIDHTLRRQAFVDYLVQIITTGAGASELIEAGSFMLVWRNSSATWNLISLASGADVSGVNFSVDSAGQVYYTSGNTTGTPLLSQVNFRQRTMVGT